MLFAGLSVIIGLCQVAQAGVNRYISKHIGLPLACVLNNVLGASCAASVFFIEQSTAKSSLPDAFENKGSFADFRVWWLLPAVFGFCIVVMIPWGIARMGAFRMFATMIAAELVFSLAWDAVFEGMPVGLVRGTTAAVVGIGAALVFGAEALTRRFGGSSSGTPPPPPPTQAPTPSSATEEEAGGSTELAVLPKRAFVDEIGAKQVDEIGAEQVEGVSVTINTAPSSSGSGDVVQQPATRQKSAGLMMDLLPIFKHMT